MRIGSEKEPRSVDFSPLWAMKLAGHVLLLRLFAIAAQEYIALLPVCLKFPGYFTFAEVLLCDLLEVMHFFLHLFHTTNNMGSKNHLA